MDAGHGQIGPAAQHCSGAEEKTAGPAGRRAGGWQAVSDGHLGRPLNGRDTPHHRHDGRPAVQQSRGPQDDGRQVPARPAAWEPAGAGEVWFCLSQSSSADQECAPGRRLLSAGSDVLHSGVKPQQLGTQPGGARCRPYQMVITC